MPVSAQIVLDDTNLPEYLRNLGLFEAFEEIQVEKAGDGNINWVRRASTRATSRGDSLEGKSYVIKQARPALERFPEYQAPTERIVFEARYYELARPFDHDGVCPAIHGFDPENRVLVLQDLGAAERLDAYLATGPAPPATTRALSAFLGRLHAATRNDPELAERFANGPMQELHGEHIFRLPLLANEFPLPPATRARANELAGHAALLAAARHAYDRYREPRGALVHGDVQAGNVLLVDAGHPKLLDAEIAHVGDPGFDVGTYLAHLALPAVAAGRPAEAGPSLELAWDAYSRAHGPAGLCAFPGVARYAGLEMLRRTIGAARVPCVESDASGLRVIEVALGWILDPPQQPRELLAPQ